jgi:hypothetical protein
MPPDDGLRRPKHVVAVSRVVALDGMTVNSDITEFERPVLLRPQPDTTRGAMVPDTGKRVVAAARVRVPSSLEWAGPSDPRREQSTRT